MKYATWIAALTAGLAMVLPAWSATAAQDPLASARWGEMEGIFLSAQPYVFDARVKVLAPEQSEDPMQVPVTVDATALPDVREVVVFADFNPILEVLRFQPAGALAYLGFRMKLQQSSPVRAAARTGDGVWHVGGALVNTAGGGCTAPSAGSVSIAWQKRLNEVSARVWSEGPQAGRIRLRIVHPMDTGLIAGIPAFHLEALDLQNEAGQLLMHLDLAQPVSENPVFTLQRGSATGALRLLGRDNNGNRIDTRIAP